MYRHSTPPSVSASTAPAQSQLPPAASSPGDQSKELKLHAEICAAIELYEAHANKVYFSGPLVRKFEFNSHGRAPVKDEGWMEVWAQLSGTTLSVWIMKEIEAASQEGKRAPPSYIDVTDPFTQILGAVTTPATSSSGPKRYSNILTLNNAGSNLHLFSCPNTASLISWTAAVRLAAWEKSRIEEIYTASLLRTMAPDGYVVDVPPTLVNGNLEGWAAVRISGKSEWRKVWLVVQAGAAEYDPDEQPPPVAEVPANPTGAVPAPISITKKRMSDVFPFQTNLPPVPTRLMSMYDSPEAKLKKKPPLYTMPVMRQAYAVYPAKPELIESSSLIKVVGEIGEEGYMADTWRGKDGWMLVLPEGGFTEMVKWIVAFHDVFELYGRPKGWNWDARDPTSMIFGYPVGSQKAELFLDRGIVETIDPREDRITKYHDEFKNLLKQHKFPSQ